MKWHLKHARHGNKPWAVQAEALRRADGKDRFGFWLEQGLGKTALTLNEFLGRDDVAIMVVICPQSFKSEWVTTPAEWGAGFLQSAMWPKTPPYALREGSTYVVNYEAVRWNGKTVNNFLGQLRHLMQIFPCMLVLDESYAVKSFNSDTTRGVLDLCKRAKVVRLLNGTPMPENVMDYYPQLRALGEFEGWNPYAFRNRYAIKGGFQGRQIIGQQREAELAEVLDRCSFRALKKDWRKDLPPQIVVPLHLEMSDKQRTAYQTMMEEFYALVEGDEVTAEMVLTQYDKLRQITSGILMKDGKVFRLDDFDKLSKTRALLDTIAGGDGKVIVVHHYVATGDALMEVLGKAGYQPARIAGGLQPEEVKRSKDRFNGDPACRVLVGQQRATARGHTLLGGEGRHRCHRMFFFENDFGSYWREQMKDRNHRGEQDQECTIFDPISSPIEQIVVDALIRKKSAADVMDEVVAAVRREKRWYFQM